MTLSIPYTRSPTNCAPWLPTGCASRRTATTGAYEQCWRERPHRGCARKRLPEASLTSCGRGCSTSADRLRGGVVSARGKCCSAAREDGSGRSGGGWQRWGKPPAQAAVRELWEEAGVSGRAAPALGVFDSRAGTSLAAQLCTALFSSRRQRTGAHRRMVGALRAGGVLDVGSFAERGCPRCRGDTICAFPGLLMMRGVIETPIFGR